MEQPVHPDNRGESDLPPHVLSREYEDYLDWLENQRDDRIRRGRGRRMFGLMSGLAGVVTLAGVIVNRLRTRRS